MTLLSHTDATPDIHPIDIAEKVVASNGWRFERSRDDEMAAEVNGTWCDFSLHFAWSKEICAMHFTCAFDMRIPKASQRRVHELLAIINERMWLGHFCIWDKEGLPMFRHAILLRGAPGGASIGQIEDLVDIAVSECERYYPAFQFVIWGGKKPSEALEAAIIEPVGEA